MSIAEPPVIQDEPLRRRTVVPSERQQRLGHRIEEITEQAAQQPRPRREPALRRFIRETATSLTFSWLREPGIPARPFLVLALIGFIGSFEGAAFAILVVDAQRELKIDTAVVVLVVAAASGVGQVVGPAVGYMADRMSRRTILAVGTAVGGVSGMLSGTVNGAGTLGATRGLNSLAGSLAGALSPVGPSLLSDIYPVDVRARLFGSGNALGQIGVVVGPLGAAAVAIGLGWRIAFFIFGAMVLASVPLLFLIKEPARGRIDRAAAGLTGAALDHAPPPPRLVESLRIIFAVKTFRRFMIAQPIITIAGTGLYTINYVVFIQRFHAGVGLLGVITSVSGVMSIIGVVLGMPFIDRLLAYRPGRVMYVIGASLVFDCLAFVFMTFVPFLPVAVALSLLLPLVGTPLTVGQLAVETIVLPASVRTFGLTLTGPVSLLSIPVTYAVATLAENGGTGTLAMVCIPLFILAAGVLASAGNFVEPDARAAQAAAVAEEEVKKARAAGRNKMLICRDVDVTYPGGIQVLFNVDLDIGEGEIVALLGTNGAGKSTLLRAISGLTEASNGAIFFDGRDITHLPTPAVARLGVVQVLGGRAIFPRLTVEQNLQAATWLTESDEEFVKTQRAHILDEFFPVLKTRLNERAGTLSGGEQQMLALSQAFLMKPRLLMIDELSLGLSPAVVEQLLRIVRAIHRAGTTIILVEQSVNVALTVAQRAVFMEKGEVRFDGSTEELLARPDLLRSVFFASAGGAAAGSISSAGFGEAPITSTQVLDAQHLRCRFGGVTALNDAHLTLNAGEIVGIIGPNGAGKSTLFDAISGYAPIQEGRVVLQGRDIRTMSPDGRARLGLIRSFQDARLFPSMTVAENLAVALERYGVVRSAAFSALWLPHVRRSEARIHKRVDDLVELLGLGEYIDKFAGELSTGTRRVVDLACMMAADPEVLLLDEPSSGIAQAEVQSFAPLLERIRRETGCAIAIIEHDMTLITAVSDRLVAMDLGSVVVEGSANQVLNDPHVVASYLGTSKEAIARSGAVPL